MKKIINIFSAISLLFIGCYSFLTLISAFGNEPFALGLFIITIIVFGVGIYGHLKNKQAIKVSICFIGLSAMLIFLYRAYELAKFAESFGK